MDGSADCHTEWSKSDTKTNIWYQMCGILKNDTNDLSTKQKITDVESKRMVMRG